MPIATVARQDGRPPTWTTLPVNRPVYDARHDRFVLPGFYAVERSGRVTYGLEVLEGGGQPELVHRPLDRGRAEHRILAIWHGPESRVVLHGSMAPKKSTPHGCRNPDAIQVSIFAKDEKTVRARYLLSLSDGWNISAALDRFLLDGSLIAPVDARRSFVFGRPSERGRWLGRSIGRRSATIRIDALGRVSVLPHGRWAWSAGARASTGAAPMVWGVRGRWPRQRLVAASSDGSEHVHALPHGAEVTSISAHDGGACVLVRREYDRELACLDDVGRVLWGRTIPEAASGELVVDDEGRVFMATVDGVIALDSRGTTLWRWTGRTPRQGTMMIAGLEVCFFADSTRPGQALGSRTVSDRAMDLVCLTRRGPS